MVRSVVLLSDPYLVPTQLLVTMIQIAYSLVSGIDGCPSEKPRSGAIRTPFNHDILQRGYERDLAMCCNGTLRAGLLITELQSVDVTIGNLGQQPAGDGQNTVLFPTYFNAEKYAGVDTFLPFPVANMPRTVPTTTPSTQKERGKWREERTDEASADLRRVAIPHSLPSFGTLWLELECVRRMVHALHL